MQGSFRVNQLINQWIFF